MALDPVVLEARIHCRVCELRLLAAQTAVDWGDRARERELAKNRRNPRVMRLARALLDASKTAPENHDPLVDQLVRAILDAAKTASDDA